MSDQREPQSIKKWIDRVNEAEQQLDQSDDDLRRMPSGWWILPVLLVAALLFAIVASRLITGVIE